MSNLKAYVTGFILSVLLIAAAYVPVFIHVHYMHLIYSHTALTIYILALAVVQLIAQLVLFLHLGREQKPRWNLGVFLATISLVLIVVVGSLWIMAHLNYNMTPQQMNDYIIRSENFFK